MGNNLSDFREGDDVMIGIKDLEVIEQMQENHGGWNEKMRECQKGPCKLIQGIGTDVLIKAPSGGVYRVNPEILTKYVSDEFQIGTEVVITDKEEDMVKLQTGHGGWSDGMKDLLGKTAEIVKRFPDGDYKIKVNGRSWTVNPECFIIKEQPAVKDGNLVSVGNKVNIINNKGDIINFQIGHGGWSDLMNLILGQEVEVVEVMEDGDCYVSKFGMKWMVNPKCFKTEKVAKETYRSQLMKGDTVKISDDINQCKELQKYHGGWLSGMKVFCGKIGVVDIVLPTEDVKVQINGLSFVYNPLLLTKVSQDLAEPKSAFKEGDKVKVIKDKNRVKRLQKNHGEWIDTMRLILGEKGKVKSIFPDGDLRVKIMGNLITLNPECVKKDESDSDSDVPDVMKMMRQMAKMLGHTDTDSSADSDKEDSGKETPSGLNLPQMKFLAAVKAGDVEQVNAMVELVGPNFSKQKLYPLMVAVNEGHEKVVEILLVKGANINEKDSDGDTALHLAVQKNRVEICRLLIKKGANVNEQNNTKMTPVMLAAVKGVQEILRMLVATAGVNLNIGDKDKDTALHLAIQKSRNDSVEILLEAGADIMLANDKQFSSYHMAALRGHEKILEAFLIKAGPSIVDLQKEDKFASIHIAALNNHPGCLKVLIKYNADVNIRNEKLQTPLHIAVSQGYLECVKMLVEAKAEMNLKDDSGDTALHDGVRAHNLDKMKVQNGGDLFGVSDMFKLMKDMNKGSDKPAEIVIFLAENGARLDIKNNSGQTAIMACQDEVLKAQLLSIKEGRAPPTEPTPETLITIPSRNEESELVKLKLKVKKLEDENMCIICYDRKIDCTFTCGHVSCEVCANNLYECHMCRTPIDNIIKIFR